MPPMHRCDGEVDIFQDQGGSTKTFQCAVVLKCRYTTGSDTELPPPPAGLPPLPHLSGGPVMITKLMMTMRLRGIQRSPAPFLMQGRRNLRGR